MEVQPINIQLNTSTDDDSENENSLLHENAETTEAYPGSEYLPTPVSIYSATCRSEAESLLQYTPEDSAEMAVKLCVDEPEDESTPSPIEGATGQMFADGIAEFIPGQYHVVRSAANEQVVPDQADITRGSSTNANVATVVQSDMVSSQEFYTSVDNGGYVNTVCGSMMYPGPYVYPNMYYQGCNYVVPNALESESMMSVSTTTYDNSYMAEYAESTVSEAPVEDAASVAADVESIAGQEYTAYEAMVYPSLYVSSAGLLTVLLQQDIAVEMTLDRAIRVINNRHRAVAATNNKGSSSCIHHPAAKIFQEDSTTEAEIFWERRTKLTSERALFSCAASCFQLGENGMRCALPEFSELSNDMSVTILFSSSGYGPHLTSSFEDLVSTATYRYYKDNGISVWVNGIKIHQSAQGDVTINSGRKTIRASPVFGTMYVETPLVEMSVERNWNVKIMRGQYRVNASLTGLIVSDGNRECGFDQFQQVFIQPATIRKQPIIRNGVSVGSPWRRGSHDNSRGGQYNYYNDRYFANRYHYNRYQNYHHMNNHNNNNVYRNSNYCASSRFNRRGKNSDPIRAVVSASCNSLSSSDATVIADGE